MITMSIGEDQLVLFESQLINVLQPHGLALGERYQHHEGFEWYDWNIYRDTQEELQFRGRPAGVYARVTDTGHGADFEIGPASPWNCRREWSSLKAFYSDDMRITAEHLGKVLGFMETGAIPDAFLRPQRTWARKPALVPKAYAKQVPIMEAIRMYEWEDMGRRIEARVEFRPERAVQEIARVFYTDKRYSETASVVDGRVEAGGSRYLPHKRREDIEHTAEQFGDDEMSRKLAAMLAPHRTAHYESVPALRKNIPVLREIGDGLVQEHLQPLYGFLE